MSIQEQNKPMRKAREMTYEERQQADACLPGPFEFYAEEKTILCTGSQPHPDLPLRYIKYLTDYLTSINVDPYGA